MERYIGIGIQPIPNIRYGYHVCAGTAMKIYFEVSLISDFPVLEGYLNC